MIGVVKGEFVWWTNLLRSFDTRPLRAFIMKSIHFFIICISTTMYSDAVFAMNGHLVSWHSSLLGALLSSGLSWSLILVLVLSCSSLRFLGLAFLWRHLFEGRK